MGDKLDFSQLLEQQIAQALDSAVQSMVQQTLTAMILDPAWIAKIETIVNQTVTRQVLGKLSTIDVNSIISSVINDSFDVWKKKLAEDFKSTGIEDHATSCQLVVTDEAVVSNGGLAGQELLIDSYANVRGTLNVRDLIVTGTINTDNRSWNELGDSIANKVQDRFTTEWRDQLVKEVTEMAKTQSIDFESITINGSRLIDGSSLSKTITESSLESVGALRNLTVSGTAKFGDDVLNIGSRRIGINTTDPEMALGIWDEEVSMLVGKYAKDHAYVGTGRKQKLTLGVDRGAQIELGVDGVTAIKDLRVDRFRIGFANQIPGHSGTRGDFLINSDPKPNEPFAWRCLGGFKWEPVGGNK